HTLFGERISGVYLHANYIEALLDGRYLRPYSPQWANLIFASWLIFLYLVFWAQPEAALIIAIGVAFLVKQFMIQQALTKGVYPEIWIEELGLIALFLRYTDSRGHRLIDGIKEQWFSRQPNG